MALISAAIALKKLHQLQPEVARYILTIYLPNFDNLSSNKLMSKTKKSINSNLKGQSFHDLLNIDTFKAIAMAIALTVAIYVICLIIGDSYLKSLLYERGFTQYIVVLMASSVTVFTVFKYQKIALESKQLNKNFIDENVNFDNHQAYELVNLQRSLSQGKSFIAVRLSRVVSAYINSGNSRVIMFFKNSYQLSFIFHYRTNPSTHPAF